MRLAPSHRVTAAVILCLEEDGAAGVDADVAAAYGEDEGAHVVGEVDAVGAPAGLGYVVGFVDAVFGFVGGETPFLLEDADVLEFAGCVCEAGAEG